jgi:class 3 adenylate cyclase
LAVDKDGKMLAWKGAGGIPSSPSSAPSPSQPPASYPPPHLAERIRAEQAALEARGGTDGERKTITALFADLKGSTALIEGLDPEDARAIIDPALQLMMDAVHRYEGYVAQALGDGIFALFGAPIAHEDHPQRALYAALHMQEEMCRYADLLRQKGYPPLLMRVGINTGEVVVRSIRKDDLHADYVPVGHSTNLAARMEQLAALGSSLRHNCARLHH